MAATWHAELKQNLPELLVAGRDSLTTIARSRAFLTALAIVALVDGVLLGLGLATVYVDSEGGELPSWFYLNAEFSFGEIWEYSLTVAAATGLLWRYRRLREPVVGYLGLVFAWLTLDNALALHEAIGHAISPLFMFAEHSKPNPDDYGELVSLCVIAAAILFGFARTALASARQSVFQSLAIIAVLGTAAFFGVCIDFIDAALSGHSQLVKSAMSFIEDGGEMVLLSIAAAGAVAARPSFPRP